MTNEQIQRNILNFLPKEDWSEATRRAKLALDKGYYSLGLWEGWSKDENGDYQPDPPELNDLVGVNPETGMLELIGADGPLGKTRFNSNIEEEI